ncbi:sigma-70 family RNA polymerase sigma factor [Microbispora sp. H10949]|uniref:sigma-70 family RNA polymerase sigma factor n=1 Tax=Microbispora sp. H10949 TaxID=2729111 RepID=UPI0015FF2EF6|nr:sigma-70 family RNA polymerase sigma factor [Microbispora sp. H10949]
MWSDEEFERITGPHRRELMAHCYRMLGSAHDAEDLLQEVMLRAWRASGDYDERRASPRTWLYRIATNACLTALEQRGRRALPSGLAGPGDDPEAGPGRPLPEVTWLEPIPDALVDPAAVVASRGGIRLAFVAALQHLPPRQRAVLILREVLAWRASEVADLLDTSVAAVNSALQRARAQLARVGAAEDDLAEPDDPACRDLLDRYVAAFEKADVETLERLLREDAVLEMPPFLSWFAGREDFGRFIRWVCGRRGPWRMVPTRANGQPALAAYVDGGDGVLRAHSLQVLEITEGGVARNVVFGDPTLFTLFALPAAL